ncbi:MAG: hypothetical protein ACXW1D_00790 [Halobacteriota archaeon]
MNKEAVVGDVVVFLYNETNLDGLTDVTIGREYTIVGFEECYDFYDEVEHLVFFIDDAGDANFAAAIDGDGIFEIVGRV